MECNNLTEISLARPPIGQHSRHKVNGSGMRESRGESFPKCMTPMNWHLRTLSRRHMWSVQSPFVLSPPPLSLKPWAMPRPTQPQQQLPLLLRPFLIRYPGSDQYKYRLYTSPPLLRDSVALSSSLSPSSLKPFNIYTLTCGTYLSPPFR